MYQIRIIRYKFESPYLILLIGIIETHSYVVDTSKKTVLERAHPLQLIFIVLSNKQPADIVPKEDGLIEISINSSLKILFNQDSLENI